MNGYECSKQSIAEQILDDFEDILTTTLYQTLKQREKMDSNGNGFIHFTGRVVAYDDLIDILPELRKKYGVD
jgi:hypothetical protein